MGSVSTTILAVTEVGVSDGEDDTPEEQTEEQSLFSSGKGTSQEPWMIADVIQLSAITNYLGAEHSDKFFCLSTNICFSAEDFSVGGRFYNKGAGWYPIGNRGDTNQMFCGKFDGNGYSISNLKIFRRLASDVGLFGYTQGAEIKNLSLDNLDIRGSQNVGGLIGVDENSLIRSCSVQGKVYAASVCGGLIGAATETFIHLCKAECQVDATLATSFEDTYNVVGGLVGFGTKISIMECSTAGSVSAWTSTFLGRTSGAAYAGGIAGYLSISSLTHVSSFADIYASTSSQTNTGDAFAGGLVGYAHEVVLMNSYAQGVGVEAYARTGTDSTDGEGVAYAGGMVGFGLGFVATTCYAGNSVLAESDNSLCYAAGLGSGENVYIESSVALNDFVDAENLVDIGGIISTNYIGRISALDGTNFVKNLALDKLQVVNNSLNVTEYIMSDISSKNGETCEEDVLKSPEIYESIGWDFGTDWLINTNGLPELEWEASGLTPRKPKIVSRSSDIVVTKGDAFTLKVTAVGSQTLQYRWFKDGLELEPLVWDEKVHTVGEATMEDQGIYTALVTNEFGEDLSSEILVTVIEPVTKEFSLKYTLVAGDLLIQVESEHPVTVMLQSSLNMKDWVDEEVLATGKTFSVKPEGNALFYRGILR